MFDRLLPLTYRFDELSDALATNEIAADPEKSVKLMRERAKIEPLVEAYRRWQSLEKQLIEARELEAAETDPDLKEMAREEQQQLAKERDTVASELRELMVPRDPRDDDNCIVEIRAGTGGDEAGLFSADLLRMYTRFAETRGLKVEVMSANDTEIGGFKEVVIFIQGVKAFALFKHESGTHRVQRIPSTESQGRIHTSACTVAVLPEVDDVEVDIRDGDLRIDTYRAGGAGGQHVNRTDSAVRITHLPTGVVVQCQDERSQLKNKARAMMQLRAKLFDAQQQQIHDVQAANRKEQVGSGDRSERIRTYNFPQNRLTDHRVGLTLYNLDQVMQGNLGDVVQALLAHERAALLAQDQQSL
jgi:peptide chain release factor 1